MEYFVDQEVCLEFTKHPRQYCSWSHGILNNNVLIAVPTLYRKTII